jgi:hypothetical protein
MEKTKTSVLAINTHYKLGDWLMTINQTKKNIMDEDPYSVSRYPYWLVNKALSSFSDCVLFVNEINKYPLLPKKMQYDFYINSLRPRRRFSPWVKKESIEYLEEVQEYYGFSYTKALDALRILSQDQLEQIKKIVNKGGRDER